MRRAGLILALTTFALVGLAQESRDAVISGSFRNMRFEQFASELRSNFGIQIFFSPESVEDLRIDISGDSIDLNDYLSSLLEPSGINLFYNNKKQFFVTGPTEITDHSQRNISIGQEENKEGAPDASQYFGSFSYEKKINRAVIGSRDRREATGTSVISGRITSKNSGEPVIGATVVVEGTTKGVITNGDGYYALTIEPGSTYTLQVSCLGMEKETYIVDVNSSGVLNIEMNEQLITLQEVVVRSGKHDNVRGVQMGFQKIDIKEIKSIPAVMGERDILKVAKMMPGVQSVGEGSAGFNVRGSSSDQNLFLVNEIPVMNTGHLFGFFSAFNPDMVNDFNLYKSSFPVEYGGRLASVFEISTRKGNKKKFGARGALSPVTGSILFETPIVKDKVSLITAVRSTYSDWILDRLDNPDIRNSNASFSDIMSGIHILPDNSSSLQLFGYYSKDKFTLGSINDYWYENMGSSLIYDRKLNSRWSVNIAGVLSRYINYHSSTENPAKGFDNLFSVDQSQVKLKFTGYQFVNHRTGAGTDFTLHSLNQGAYLPYGEQSLISPLYLDDEKGLEYSFHLFDEYSVTDWFTIYAGLRYSFFNYLGPAEINTYPENGPRNIENISGTKTYDSGTIQSYSGPEFRLSLNFRLSSDFSLKSSYNRMRQYLFMLSNTVAISPTDRWKLTDSFIKPPVADQLSFGLYKNVNRFALETSAEFYVKKTRNIVEYKDGADLSLNSVFETLILQGLQDSWGAEFLVRRNAGRFTGWMSYTYSRSMITVDGDNWWEKINEGLTYPSNYDKPHAFNIVANFKFSRRFSFASNLVYNTGRPITYPAGTFNVSGIQGVSYSTRNEYRIPDYFRIDMSINVEGNLLKRKFAHGSWMFAVYNVTGRKNAYSVYFKNEEGKLHGYKQSIYGVPIFTVSYNFKLGNYAVE